MAAVEKSWPEQKPKAADHPLMPAKFGIWNLSGYPY